jgi:DNA-binding MarR family transcriptional regulator
MHAINFQLKRAHWTAVAVGKRVLRKVPGMTPARFDVLYLIRRTALTDSIWTKPLEARHGVADMARELGLHPSTVGRLVRRLEEMGWVRREISTDMRSKNVFLTRLGLAKIHKAMKIVFRKRVFLGAYERMFRRERAPVNRGQHIVRRIHRVVTTARFIARAFGDESRVWYDYGYSPANVHLALKLP